MLDDIFQLSKSLNAAGPKDEALHNSDVSIHGMCPKKNGGFVQVIPCHFTSDCSCSIFSISFENHQSIITVPLSISRMHIYLNMNHVFFLLNLTFDKSQALKGSAGSLVGMKRSYWWEPGGSVPCCRRTSEALRNHGEAFHGALRCPPKGTMVP